MSRRDDELEVRVRTALRHRAERLHVSPRPFDPHAEPLAGSLEVTRRSTRPRLIVAAAALTLVVAGIAIAATRSGSDDPTSQVNAAGSHRAVPRVPEAGDPAVWTIARTRRPLRTPRASRPWSIAWGATAERPDGSPARVIVTDTEITITFNVEADPGMFTCPGNNQVPYEVDLGQPSAPVHWLTGAVDQTDQHKAPATAPAETSAGSRRRRKHPSANPTGAGHLRAPTSMWLTNPRGGNTPRTCHGPTVTAASYESTCSPRGPARNTVAGTAPT